MRVAAGTQRMLGARPQRYVDIARPSNNAGARVIAPTVARYIDFRPQPEGGEGLCLGAPRYALAAQRDGALSSGFAAARPSVAHAELVQSFPRRLTETEKAASVPVSSEPRLARYMGC